MTAADPAVPANSARAAILVLGMHRSGTSAFARVASLLGCELPGNVMQPDEGNDFGFWESNAVVTLNDRLLASAGSRWDDWLPLNDGWAQSAVRADFLARARDVIQEEYGASPLFVLKDPRICRLAPLWIEALESLDIRPLIALPQRNPYEVADSLAARDGSDRGLGLLLWLRHVLEAEAATRHVPRFFFTFDQLLADWTNVAEGFERATGVRFPGRSVLTEEQVSAFLTESARHYREAESDALGGTAPAWVSETYAIMRGWCDDKARRDDVARLDAIRAEFNSAAPSISRIIKIGVNIGEGVGSAGRARKELVEVNAELELLRGKLADLTEDRDELASKQVKGEELTAAIAAAQEELERLRGDLNSSEQASDVLRKELAAEVEKAERMAAELAEVGSALRQRQEEAAQAWAEVNTERQLRERADAELQRAIGQNERLIERFSEIEANIRANVEALAESRARVDEAEREAAALRLELGEAIRGRDADIERLNAHKNRADSELTQLTMLYAEAQVRLRELEMVAQTAAEPEPVSFNGAVSEKVSQIEWLRDATAVLRKRPAWWGLLPEKARLKHEGALLKAHGLFDPDAYLESHPDVGREGMDPLVHYLNHGIFEGRKW